MICNTLMIPLFVGLGSGEILIFFAFFLAWALVLIDVLKSRFKDTFTKILWLIIVLIIPLVGILAYLIIGRGKRISISDKPL